MVGVKEAKHAGEKAKGKVKETVGTLSGNKRLKAEDKVEQRRAGLKQSGEPRTPPRR